MMIENGRGNLLLADVEALVNTVGVMGRGIALQFKRAYPANYQVYRAACARDEVRMGEILLFDSGLVGPRRYILNFPTKRHWRDHSYLKDIATGLDALVKTVQAHGVTSIAIPALGCGNGGLDWADVRPLIERACERIPHVRVVVFAPEGAPAPATMPNATARPGLTARRALLLMAIELYLQRARLQEVREGISELEIQKLAYLLQQLGAPLQLQFNRAPYGPYAPSLSRDLSDMEGHYLLGFGDRSAPVTEFAPINPIRENSSAVHAVLQQVPGDLKLLDVLLDLVDGFETPYNLELLATVHFAAVQEPSTSDPSALAVRVAQWSQRKARLLTARHVGIAAERLREHRLLAAV